MLLVSVWFDVWMRARVLVSVQHRRSAGSIRQRNMWLVFPASEIWILHCIVLARKGFVDEAREELFSESSYVVTEPGLQRKNLCISHLCFAAIRLE